MPQVAPGASPASPRSLPSGSLSGLTRPELREPWSKDTPGGAAALEVNVSKTQTRLPARARGVTSYSTGQTDNGERTEQRSELGQQHATVGNAEWQRCGVMNQRRGAWSLIRNRHQLSSKAYTRDVALGNFHLQHKQHDHQGCGCNEADPGARQHGRQLCGRRPRTSHRKTKLMY